MDIEENNVKYQGDKCRILAIELVNIVRLLPGNDQEKRQALGLIKQTLNDLLAMNNAKFEHIKGEFLCAFGYDVVLTKCVILK